MSRSDLPDVEVYDSEHAVWLHWMHLCCEGCEPGESKTFFAASIGDELPVGHSLLWDGNIACKNVDGVTEYHNVWYIDSDGHYMHGQDESRAVTSQCVWTFIRKYIFKPENLVEAGQQLCSAISVDIAFTTVD